jgi:hypothetical protein
MYKEEFITKYGEDVYNNKQVQSRAWQKALVEADQHMHGVINVIEVRDGNITLLTEERVKNA